MATHHLECPYSIYFSLPLFENHPELMFQVQLGHLKVLHHFRAIELYEHWLSKIEDLFGLQNHNLYIGSSSQEVYAHQFELLSKIIKVDRTLISKVPYWVENLKHS